MNPLLLLARPWVMAVGTGLLAYSLYRRNREARERLKNAKLELLEQQRTIDRLRADLGRERHFRDADPQQQSY